MPNTDHIAKRCNRFAYLLGRLVMKVSGWQVQGEVPNSKKMIIIAAPHTTNWDFIYLLAAAYSFRLSINWLGKKAIFIPIFGRLMKYLGGVPVNRNKHTNMVHTMADIISSSEYFSLVVPPAGTRSKTLYWKSGFYRIALATGIPIVCGSLDYEKKIACLGLSFVPSGDISADMDRIRDYYRPIQGKYPENTSHMRLKEEDVH